MDIIWDVGLSYVMSPNPKPYAKAHLNIDGFKTASKQFTE